uniref:Immunoglobulin heavy variable 6-1 n=1 Tax=Poecilia reticulata TaxID=8081 RepID=A0A3P9MU40_POERE
MNLPLSRQTSECEQLTQPAAQTVQPGQSLTISCQVSYSLGSYSTFWIRQAAGKTLEWIGAARTGYTTNYNNMMKNKFSITLQDSSKTVYLQMNSLTAGDSAVYYCARETQTGMDWAKKYWLFILQRFTAKQVQY